MGPRTAFAGQAGRAGALGLLLLAVGLLAGCQGPQLMPTPNVYVQAQSTPCADVAPPLRTNTVDVLYATDRQLIPQADGTLAYGAGRSLSLAVGSCVVEIGQHIAWDTLVAQSQQAERRQALPLRPRIITEQIRCPATPMPVVLHHGQPTVAPAAQAAYVYVHGYNNTCEDGALVIAERWHFLGRQGVPILYTWPAGFGGDCAAIPTTANRGSSPSFT